MPKANLHENLKKLCTSNEKFFNKHKSTKGKQFEAIFAELSVNIDKVCSLAGQIEAFAREYDFDAETPGNGFRSFVAVSTSALEHTEKIVNVVEQKRENFLFNKDKHLK